MCLRTKNQNFLIEFMGVALVNKLIQVSEI